jgi:hypothetical protein
VTISGSNGEKEIHFDEIKIVLELGKSWVNRDPALADLLGTPDTNLSGRRTRIARRVRRSTPSSGLPAMTAELKLGSSGVNMVMYLKTTPAGWGTNERGIKGETKNI